MAVTGGVDLVLKFVHFDRLFSLPKANADPTRPFQWKFIVDVKRLLSCQIGSVLALIRRKIHRYDSTL